MKFEVTFLDGTTQLIEVGAPELSAFLDHKAVQAREEAAAAAARSKGPIVSVRLSGT